MRGGQEDSPRVLLACSGEAKSTCGNISRGREARGGVFGTHKQADVAKRTVARSWRRVYGLPYMELQTDLPAATPARARIRCTGAPAKASTSNSAIAAGGSSSSDSRRVWSRSAGECGSTRGASKQPAREPLRRGSQHADRKRVRSVATIRGRRGALRRRDAATTRGALLPAGGRGAKPRDDDRPVPSRCRR